MNTKKLLHLFIPLFLFPLFASATFWTDDAESYSTGDILNDNGGTNWSTAWGGGGTYTGGCSVGNWEVVANSIAPTGSQDFQSPNGDACQRGGTANTTNNEILQFYVRKPNTTSDSTFQINLDAASANIDTNVQMWFRLRSTGQFAIKDNITVTDLGAYSANTTYTIQIKPIDYANGTETWAISTDGGSTFSSTYHMYNYTVLDHSVGSKSFVMVQGGTGTLKVDDISDATTVAGGSVKQPDAQWW